jgi:hypothetical protein
MKRLALLVGLLLLVAAAPLLAFNNSQTQEKKIASAVTGTGVQAWYVLGSPAHTFTCAMTVSSGSGSATVKVEAAPGPLTTAVITLQSLSVTDTAPASYTDASSKFGFYRVEVTAISGTGAAVTCYAGS